MKMNLYPLFPLELVAYPLEKLKLHIFEPRYKQLIENCAREKFLFGIPCYRKNKTMEYGSLMRLLKIEKKYRDGKMDITTEGVCVFRLDRYLETYPDRLFPGGYIKKLKLDLNADPKLILPIRESLLELYDFMNITSIPKALEKENFYTFEIAHKVGLNKDQEYDFLQIPTEMERQEYLILHLGKLIPMARNMEEMRTKIQQNGQFKGILPPQI